MDAVISGLIAGAAASLLLVFAGAIAQVSDAQKSSMTTDSVFAWLVILTALTVGQLGVTGMLLQKIAAGPSQSKDATVG